MSPDAAVQRYAAEIARLGRQVLSSDLLGVYVHGPTVLGGYTPVRSDVDLLVLVSDRSDVSQASPLGEVLAAVEGCPGVGLEASAVTRTATRTPAAPWPFIVHVSTIPGSHKLVLGTSHPGDPDLALHYAVARQSGWAAYGPPAADVVGPVPQTVLVERMVDELAWGLQRGNVAYTVLNAARALYYSAEGLICSKLEGGEWALAHGEPADVLAPALAEQRGGSATELTAAQAKWIREVRGRLQ